MEKRQIAQLIDQAKRQQVIFAKNKQYFKADQLRGKIKLLIKKLKE